MKKRLQISRFLAGAIATSALIAGASPVMALD